MRKGKIIEELKKALESKEEKLDKAKKTLLEQEKIHGLVIEERDRIIKDLEEKNEALKVTINMMKTEKAKEVSQKNKTKSLWLNGYYGEEDKGGEA